MISAFSRLHCRSHKRGIFSGQPIHPATSYISETKIWIISSNDLLHVVSDKQKSLEMILIHPVCCWETCIKELGNLRNFRQILYPERLSEGKLKESKLNSVCYFFYTVSLIFWSFITIYYTGGGALCGVVGSLNISIQVLIFWLLFGPNRCYKRNIFRPTIS